MDDTKLIKDQLLHDNININDILHNTSLPSISLPNQDGIFLKINRIETFRLVIFFYSMTGHPNKKLPHNWNNIPGAKGCTLENSIFRDNYNNLIELNALPIGVSTQSVEDIKEMTQRLRIQFDILSDFDLILAKELSLPLFSINEKYFIKRLTMIVEKNTIKKIFYPVVSINKHIDDILLWLKEN